RGGVSGIRSRLRRRVALRLPEVVRRIVPRPRALGSDRLGRLRDAGGPGGDDRGQRAFEWSGRKAEASAPWRGSCVLWGDRLWAGAPKPERCEEDRAGPPGIPGAPGDQDGWESFMSETPKSEVRIPDRPKIPEVREETTLVLGKAVPIQVENPGMISRRIPIAVSCAQCGDKMTRDPATVPFQTGPFKGGFLCKECWVLYWDEHPEILAAAASGQWVKIEARASRVKRAAAGPH